jgi:hypothetical protein
MGNLAGVLELGYIRRCRESQFVLIMSTALAPRMNGAEKPQATDSSKKNHVDTVQKT